MIQYPITYSIIDDDGVLYAYGKVIFKDVVALCEAYKKSNPSAKNIRVIEVLQ